MRDSFKMSQNDQVPFEGIIVKKINKFLNASETRSEGLELLNLFLRQCSDEDFLQFCISWMQNCCKADASTKNTDHAIYLLSKLLKISSSYPELKKSVSFFITTRYFDYFFKYLLKSKAGWCCTELCLLFFRGACGPFQATLEKHLKSEIKRNTKISLIVGECYALMPCIGGGGSKGENYVRNWKSQFVSLLNACHFILNDFFSNVEEIQEYDKLTCKNGKKNEREAEHLTTQLRNHSLVLNCMLLNKYPASKSVPSDLLFRLICRGLALNPKMEAKSTTSSVVSVERFLPEIQCSLLSLLRAVIVSCKTQLLPYSHLICKLIKQALEWTENHFTCRSGRTLGDLRVLAYEALCDWLVVARSGSCVEVVSTFVVPTAVSDIRSKKKLIFLKGDTKFQNRLKEKEQKTKCVDTIDCSRLCCAALKALRFLLKFVGVLLKPEEHKFLQEVVVKLVTDLQKNSSSVTLIPFGVPAIRTGLYYLLLELVCQPCPRWPPPTNYALRLFREGMNDSSIDVSSFCSSALNLITIIIHPQYDNGGFPVRETTNFSARAEVNNERENRKGEDNLEQSTEVEKIFIESDKLDKREKLKNLSNESEISSDEDSRNTVKFSEGSVEPDKRTFSLNKTRTDTLLAETILVNYEPQNKKQKISPEEGESENILLPFNQSLTESSPVKETQDSFEIKKPGESTPLEEFTCSKIVLAESSGEIQSKRRYYLRSKTKDSSEEGEEVAEKTSSPDASKNTPIKSLSKSRTNAKSAIKRPRTRLVPNAVSNIETKLKTPEKSGREDDDGDEEDIKAAFDDSFID